MVCIRWLIVAMLFIVFLEARVWHQSFPAQPRCFAAGEYYDGCRGVGPPGWRLAGGRDIALAAFFTGISPTATAAPVIVGLLRGRVEYVATAFMLTNLTIAALMPFMLPVVLGQRHTAGVFADFRQRRPRHLHAHAGGVGRPGRARASAAEWPVRLRGVSFGLWVTAIFLITADASSFLHTQAGTAHLRC